MSNVRKARDKLEQALDPDYEGDPWVLIDEAHDLLEQEVDDVELR